MRIVAHGLAQNVICYGATATIAKSSGIRRASAMLGTKDIDFEWIKGYNQAVAEKIKK